MPLTPTSLEIDTWRRNRFRHVSNVRRTRLPRLLEQYGHRAVLARHYTTARGSHQDAKRTHHQAVLHAKEAGQAAVLKLHAAGDSHDEVLRSLERKLNLRRPDCFHASCKGDRRCQRL